MAVDAGRRRSALFTALASRIATGSNGTGVPRASLLLRKLSARLGSCRGCPTPGTTSRCDSEEPQITHCSIAKSGQPRQSHIRHDPAASLQKRPALSRTCCRTCQQTFPSRSKLFAHLRAQGHGFDFAPTALLGVLKVARSAVASDDPELALQMLKKAMSLVVRARRRSDARMRISACTDSGHSALGLAIGMCKRCPATASRLTAALGGLVRALTAAGANDTGEGSNDVIWGSDAAAPSGIDALRQYGSDSRHDWVREALCKILRVEGGRPLEKCPVCDDEEFIWCCSSLTRLACGHAACAPSLAGWIEAQVDSGATYGTIRCHVCPHVLAPAECAGLLPPAKEAAVRQRTLELALRRMPNFRWCPRCPSGGFFRIKKKTARDKTWVEVAADDCEWVECCACQYRFEPGQSQYTFQRRVEGEKSDAWKDEHTKPCPSCFAPILRSGGCSHMTCSACEYQFCWICRGKYQPGKFTTSWDPKNPKCPCAKSPAGKGPATNATVTNATASQHASRACSLITVCDQ